MAWVHRYRRQLFAAWIVHCVVLHALLIGVPSWDGLSFRIPPVIELIQHGSFGLDKFWEFPLKGFVPFAELAQLPLLAVLGLRGLLITGPLLLFPLCVLAVAKLGAKLTGRPEGGTCAALAYAAIPMINEQPFSGYVDYIVAAALAYFLFALLELRDAERPLRAAIRVAIATALVSLSKPTGLYLCGAIAVPLVVHLYGRLGRRAVLVALAALAAGAVPALAIQIVKLVHYGNPTYPYQLSLFGISFGPGMPMAEMFRQSGLAEVTWLEQGRNFVHAWLWPVGAPINFFDSRGLGGGLVLPIALVCLPVFVRTATRTETWVGATLVLVSLLARDFWYPRFSYALVIALCVVIGRALPALADAPRGRWRFWAVLVALLVHLARPEYALSRIHREYTPRLDVAGSPWFVRGFGALTPAPDENARLVIIEATRDWFLVPLYGRRLTNEVVGLIPRAAVGDRCEGLRPLAAIDPDLLIVDELELTKGCPRACAFGDRWGMCRAWRLFPAAR